MSASDARTRTARVVRLATVEDASSIAAVLHRAFVEYQALYTPDAFAATTPGVEQIQARWHEGPVWVALAASEIVGTVAAVPEAPSLYVRSMAIVPEARGQRIGPLLLQHVEEFARTQGFDRLRLCTTPFLERAVRLYEESRFQRTNDGLDDLFGTPLIGMTKPLDAAH
jgi:GNAT superfamily N-acetyltransferase